MLRFIRIELITFCIFLSFRGFLSAEDIDLGEIIVTPLGSAEGYGSSSRKVDVITKKDIEDSGARDLSELITGETSVNISNYGGLGSSRTVRMRGSTAAEVLVLLDGRPINNPRDGEANLSNIPLDDIERIEVMHGPGSHVYGSQAMAGVVNIITQNPPEEGQSSSFRTSFGTFRTYYEKLSYGAKVNDLGLIFNGGYQSSEGFRKNTEFTSKDWNAKFTYKLNEENKLSLRPSFYYSKAGTPGSIASPDTDDKEKNLNNSLDLVWESQFGEATQVLVRAYNDYERLEFIENTAGSLWDTPFAKAVHTTKVYGIELRGQRKIFGDGAIIGGLNYVRNLNDSTSNAKHRYIVRAGYLQANAQFFERLKAGVGLRMDDYSNFGQKFNPSADFLYQATDKLKIRALISRSFRAPTFNDLYWPDEGWAKGNPELQPEKGTTGEFGVDYRMNKNVNFSLTYYRSKFTDLINWAPEGGVWTPLNVGSAQIDGIEFENTIYFFDNFEFILGYTYLRAKDKDTHKFLIYQPQEKVDTTLRFDNHKGFLAEIKAQFTGLRYHDPANSIKVKEFFLWTLYASKQIHKGINFYTRIDNMLARKYQVIKDYPMPGFSITGGFKLEF